MTTNPTKEHHKRFTKHNKNKHDEHIQTLITHKQTFTKKQLSKTKDVKPKSSKNKQPLTILNNILTNPIITTSNTTTKKINIKYASYGLNKKTNAWLNPYVKENVGELSETIMQQAIDEIEENAGGEIDFIVCSAPVRRAYQESVSAYRRNVDVMNLQGGFKAISYNGIPLVIDRFVKDDEMYLLNTKEFELCQLGDWQWLEGNDGRIIKQKEGYPIYTATLVKYADLLCNRPNNQAKLSGIIGA
jgi:hypothetical protein